MSALSDNVESFSLHKLEILHYWVLSDKYISDLKKENGVIPASSGERELYIQRKNDIAPIFCDKGIQDFVLGEEGTITWGDGENKFWRLKAKDAEPESFKADDVHDHNDEAIHTNLKIGKNGTIAFSIDETDRMRVCVWWPKDSKPFCYKFNEKDLP